MTANNESEPIYIESPDGPMPDVMINGELWKSWLNLELKRLDRQ